MKLQRFRRNLPELPTMWREPFREMERFFSDDDFFAPFTSLGRAFDPDRWMPAMDVREEDNAYTVTVELPGLTKKDIEVAVEDNVLTVRGERKLESEEGDEKKGRFHRVERAYGEFARSFTLPKTVSSEKVKAEFKDGVLHLTLPKAKESLARQIEIN